MSTKICTHTVSCEKFEGLHLVEPGLMAQVGRQTGWQVDKIQLRFEVFKACHRSKYSIFCFVLSRMWYLIVAANLMHF